MLSVYLRAAAKVVESAGHVRVYTQPRSEYEWADSVLRKVHRRRRTKALVADGASHAEEERRRRAAETGKAIGEPALKLPSPELHAVNPGAKGERGARVHGGVALSTYGRTLRARSESVRGLLVLEVLRLCFITLSLAAALLTLSWLTLPIVGGSTVKSECAANPNAHHGGILPPLFIANAGFQLIFLVRTIKRACDGQWGALLRPRPGEQRRLLVNDYSLVPDLAVRACSLRPPLAPCFSCFALC